MIRRRSGNPTVTWQLAEPGLRFKLLIWQVSRTVVRPARPAPGPGLRATAARAASEGNLRPDSDHGIAESRHHHDGMLSG